MVAPDIALVRFAFASTICVYNSTLVEAPARPVERRAEMQISPGFSFTKLHYAIMRYDTKVAVALKMQR